MRSRGLESLQLENFKGFKDTGKLNLSKINIIVGKNSSGKSSLLKSIIASSQSVSQEPVDSSDFRLAGENVDLVTELFSVDGKMRYFIRETVKKDKIETASRMIGEKLKLQSKGSYKN